MLAEGGRRVNCEDDKQIKGRLAVEDIRPILTIIDYWLDLGEALVLLFRPRNSWSREKWWRYSAKIPSNTLTVGLDGSKNTSPGKKATNAVVRRLFLRLHYFEFTNEVA